MPAIWAAVIAGGATLAGGLLAKKGNEDAGDKSLEGTRLAIASEERGRDQAMAIYRDQQAAGAPGVAYLQHEVGRDPYTFTPSQKIQRKDVTRNANAALAKSGLRGSGRAVTAAVRDTTAGFDAGAVDANMRRGDAAAGMLTGQYAAGAGSGGSAALGSGGTIANLLQGGANNQADLATSNAAINGQTVGTIGSIFANYENQKARDARYAALANPPAATGPTRSPSTYSWAS